MTQTSVAAADDRPPPGDSGLLIVDKPRGWTSHQVVGRIRRLAGTKKVGHAGTLDPMATGVLVVGVNRATRLLGHLTLKDKRYLATMRLGQETVTDDAEGDVTAARGASGVSEAQILAACADQVGEIWQRPSSVSAVKVGGRRSYARVRAGEQVELAARPVHVSRLDVLEVRQEVTDAGLPVTDVDLDVECSSGTYVRALARDIGAALGCGGHLTALRRTRVGPFDLAGPHLGPDLDLPEIPATAWISMTHAARLAFPCVDVDAVAADHVGFGRALPLQLDGLSGVIGPTGSLLALYRPDGDRAVPEAVLVDPGERMRQGVTR